MASKFLFLVAATSLIVLFQSCSSYKTSKDLGSGSFSSFSKTCGPDDLPAYRTPILTKREIGYILSDLFREEITANSNISNRVNEISALTVDKLSDLTIFPENNNGKINSEVYLLQLIDIAQTVFDEYAKSSRINLECLNTPDRCLPNFLDKKLKRLWRRPLLKEEESIFSDIFKSTKSLKEKLNSAYLVALSSPQFFVKGYLPKKSTTQLTYSQFDLASRISFFLYNSVPDDLLWADAEAGKLNNVETVNAHVDRLLTQEPYASRFVRNTLSGWLHIDGDLNSTIILQNKEGVSVPLKDLAQQQYLKLSEILAKDKNISEVFYSDTIYMNKNIATYIGVDSSRYPASLESTESVPGRLESSFFASAYFANITSNNSDKTLVTERGKQIVRNFLCQPVPVNELNPAAVGAVLGPNAPKMSQIEISTIRRSNNNCLGCHKEIDRMGMGMEFLDSFGRFRQTYPSGQKISINLDMNDAKTIFANDFSSFLKTLSHDEKVHSCFLKSTASKVAPIYLDRDNACVNEILEKSANLGVRSYIKSLITSNYFTMSTLRSNE
ncbi:MAG: hypothetical protein A4S09_09830 [Proteobacteria bacterium SG_bin7]|nr:MAG: hypothetical protein A4S09_09830 [Proteobacteria bacterium SG_bin7]